MNRNELCILIRREYPKLSLKEIKTVINSAEEIIYNAVCDGEKVNLLGFGVFYPRVIAKHKKRSKLRGKLEELSIPEQMKMAFKLAKKRTLTSK